MPEMLSGVQESVEKLWGNYMLLTCLWISCNKNARAQIISIWMLLCTFLRTWLYYNHTMKSILGWLLFFTPWIMRVDGKLATFPSHNSCQITPLNAIHVLEMCQKMSSCHFLRKLCHASLLFNLLHLSFSLKWHQYSSSRSKQCLKRLAWWANPCCGWL